MATTYISGSGARPFISNSEQLGGILYNSEGAFVSLPVVATDTAAEMVNTKAILSSSFVGHSGSVIQAINFLKATQAAAADVTFVEVNNALAESTGTIYLGDPARTDAWIGGANYNIGVAGDANLLGLDAQILAVSGTISSSAGLKGQVFFLILMVRLE